MLLALRDGLRAGTCTCRRRAGTPTRPRTCSRPRSGSGSGTQFCQLVGKPADARRALDAVQAGTGGGDGRPGEGPGQPKASTGEVRLSDDGELIIPPLSAEDVPAEAAALKRGAVRCCRWPPIASLLVELDRRTGFLDCFTHAGGKQTRSPELKRNLLAVLIANATNLGLVRMAEACGISYDILAWTQEWYVREETLRGGERRDRQLPPPPAADPGVRRRHPVLLGRAAVPGRGQVDDRAGDEEVLRRAGPVDLHARLGPAPTFGTKVIVVTAREAHYVLDEILGNATDLPITEHATDTHGVTLVNFALFDLVGSSSPRGSGTWGRSPCTGGTAGRESSRYPHRGAAADAAVKWS